MSAAPASVVAPAAPPASITRKLWALSTPIIGINVLQVLMLAVDSALVGRLPGTDAAKHALEALGFATQVVFLLMVAMLGLIVGTVALVARSYGAGDHARVNHVLVQSMQLTVAVGVAVGVAGAVLAGPILHALGASDEVTRLGVMYLRPLMVATPCWYLTLVFAGVLRGVGNTRLAFQLAIVANVLNAVFNYTLVLGHFGFPALGVRGSGIGTACAQTINMLAMVAVLRSGAVANLKLPLAVARVDRPLTRELFRIGWPAALDMLILNAGFLSALGMLGRIDQVTVAAHGLGMRVQALAFVPGLSIAQATAALVGQALGAGDPARARAIVRSSFMLCLVVMTALGLLVLVAAHPLVGIFDVARGTPLERYSVEWMRILGYSMVPTAFNVTMMGLFQGSGATRTSMSINFWSTIAIQIPLSWLLGFVLDLGAIGVWIGFPLAFVIKAALQWFAYKTDRWAVTGTRMMGKPAVAAADAH